MSIEVILHHTKGLLDRATIELEAHRLKKAHLYIKAAKTLLDLHEEDAKKVEQETERHPPYEDEKGNIKLDSYNLAEGKNDDRTE